MSCLWVGESIPAGSLPVDCESPRTSCGWPNAARVTAAFRCAVLQLVVKA